MAKNRGHGEGSVYQRKDGRWVASISLENRKRKYIYGDTRREVLDKLKVALHEQKQGTLATGSQQTLKVYIEEWLEQVHKPTIRVATYEGYRTLLDKHIIPSLGHIQLQKLTPQLVQAFYAKKLESGLSSSTVRSIHSVLRKSLDNAVRWHLIPRNVCELVSLPRKVYQEMQPLTKEQAQQLINAARESKLETLLTLALATGMRKGELLGLHWQDINFETKSLQVRRTIKRLGGYGVIESEPKTAKSRRKIILPEFVLDSLKQHRVRQWEQKIKAGPLWQDNDFVFCNGRGHFFETSHLQIMFKSLLKRAGLPMIRFHDLRHSAATLLLSMGVHPKIVQEILGHSDISMTMNTYSHVLPSMQQDAMNKLNDLFS